MHFNMLLARVLISFYLLPDCAISARPLVIERPILKRSLLDVTRGSHSHILQKRTQPNVFGDAIKSASTSAADRASTSGTTAEELGNVVHDAQQSTGKGPVLEEASGPIAQAFVAEERPIQAGHESNHDPPFGMPKHLKPQDSWQPPVIPLQEKSQPEPVTLITDSAASGATAKAQEAAPTATKVEGPAPAVTEAAVIAPKPPVAATQPSPEAAATAPKAPAQKPPAAAPPVVQAEAVATPPKKNEAVKTAPTTGRAASTAPETPVKTAPPTKSAEVAKGAENPSQPPTSGAAPPKSKESGPESGKIPEGQSGDKTAAGGSGNGDKPHPTKETAAHEPEDGRAEKPKNDASETSKNTHATGGSAPGGGDKPPPGPGKDSDPVADDEERARFLNDKAFESGRKSPFLSKLNVWWRTATRPLKIGWNWFLNLIFKQKSASAPGKKWWHRALFKDVSVHPRETPNMKIARKAAAHVLPEFQPREDQMKPAHQVS